MNRHITPCAVAAGFWFAACGSGSSSDPASSESGGTGGGSAGSGATGASGSGGIGGTGAAGAGTGGVGTGGTGTGGTGTGGSAGTAGAGAGGGGIGGAGTGGGGAAGGTAGTGGTGGMGATGGGAGTGGTGGSTDPCPPGGQVPPADETKTLMHGGQSRQYNVHVPPSYDALTRTALVVNIHGLSSNGSQQEMISEMTPKADAESFIVVYPFGLDNSWNAGSCCGSSSSGMVDDVGFLTAMLDALETDLCIDRRRIFATGMSNGGFMSHRLGCELGTRIAAIAPVAGAMGVTTCNPGRSFSVLHFHGTSDSLVPYSSGESAVQDWVSQNACNATPTVTYQNGDSTCQTYSCPEGAEVTFCTVEEGGHTWPGATVFPLPTGKTTLDLNATNHMWDFFKQHPLP